MNTFYLLGFQGGACGDFLCSKISELDNFHKVPYRHVPSENTTEFAVLDIDPDFKIKSAHKKEHLILPDTSIDLINNILVSENIIVPTHYQGSLVDANIPNLVPVSINFMRLSKLFYTLVWLKRLSKTWSGYDPHNILAPTDDAEINARIQKMYDKQKIYFYEKMMVHLTYKSTEDFVKNYHKLYLKFGIIKPKGWRTVDADLLFTNPHEYIHEFNKTLGLEYSINPDTIEQYHAENIKLIERTFNKSITDFLGDNWANDLTQWVKEACPFD